MIWDHLGSAACASFSARRLLIREPHQTAEDERYGNECVALKALRLSRRNFAREILAVVKAGPRSPQFGFSEAYLRVEVCRRCAALVAVSDPILLCGRVETRPCSG